MDFPLVQTKLHIPYPAQEARQPRLVPRPRLWEKLRAGRGRRLTLVSAPVGFGKTTLLAEWITCQSSDPAAWLTLDQGDNEPVRFFAYLLAALQRAAPDFDRRIAAYLNGPNPLPLESILALLINEIGHLGQTLILVLNDYQIVESAAIHAAMRYLLEHMPSQLHLILSTRSDPPLPLARLRVRDEVQEIRAADLCFNPEEAQIFLNGIMQLNLSSASVAMLTERTEGWAAGLQLAAIYLRGDPAPERFIQSFTGSQAYIIDYLVEEVLAHLPAELTQFLLKTAILDRICASLADAVLGRHGSQNVLEQLERANLFLIPLDQERRWYRYHQLLAGMLRRLLEQTQPQALPGLHAGAATWFERNGLLGEAIQHAFASTHLEHAASLLETYADWLIARGEFATLSEWLNRLPGTLLADHPKLVLAQAECCLFYHELDKAEASLAAMVEGGLLPAEQAVARPGAPEGSIRLLGKAAVLRADIALNRGDLDETIVLTEQALRTLPSDESHLRAKALMLQGVACIWSNRYGQGCRACAEAAREAMQAGDVLTAIYAIGNHARTLHLLGRPRQAMATLQRAFAYAAEHDTEQSLVLSGCLIVYGELLYEANRLDEALTYIDEGVHRAQLARNPRSMLGGYRIRLRWCAARNRLGEIDAIVARVESLAQNYALPPAMVADFALEQAHAWLAQRQLDRVLGWFRKSGVSEDDPVVLGQERLYALLARAHYARGDLHTARQIVERVEQAVASQGTTLTGLSLAVLKSLLLAAGGDSAAAVETLRSTLHLAAPEGIIRTFVDFGSPMQRLLQTQQAALTGGPGAAVPASYLDQLLAAFGQPAPARCSPQPPESFVEPLTAREREVLRLVQEGLSDSAIAARLTVAVGTVKRHLNNIYGKLDVHSRTQALARARELHLL